VVTTESDPCLPVAQNVLDRHFGSECADQVWTSDITYVRTGEGWLFLAVVLDLFSRRIIGWAMDANMQRSLVLCALDMALSNRGFPQGVLCHSDRGSQYASQEYQQALQDAGIRCSMSRRGNCLDNAPTESFFATLKKERIYRRHYASRAQARASIFEWIEVWYNRKRRHSALGYLSPEQFELKSTLQQTQCAA
jgi:transposase InsO family protein